MNCQKVSTSRVKRICGESNLIRVANIDFKKLTTIVSLDIIYMVVSFH